MHAAGSTCRPSEDSKYERDEAIEYGGVTRWQGAKRACRITAPRNGPGSAAADEDVRVKLSHECRGASRQRDHYAHAIRVLSRCTVRWVELVSESAIVRHQSMRKFVFRRGASAPNRLTRIHSVYSSYNDQCATRPIFARVSPPSTAVDSTTPCSMSSVHSLLRFASTSLNATAELVNDISEATDDWERGLSSRENQPLNGQNASDSVRV